MAGKVAAKTNRPTRKFFIIQCTHRAATKLQGLSL
jgi:hypothetical protein